MARRKNHNNRVDLYEKAKNSRPENYAIPGSANLGTFVVKPSSVRRGKDGKTFEADPGGTKWLPTQEGN